MDSVQPDNNLSIMDEPEGGSIVQADDTDSILPGVANDGVASSSGNNPWQWTSMLKLMEQGSSTQATTTTFNTSYTTSVCTSADAQQIGSGHVPALLSSSVCSPSSSSLRDQPSADMLNREQVAFTTCDPDSSVWAQEFLSGPIGEQKSINNSCSADDGLQELFYPRTVLELLFSDQLKIDQMPSWMDILQAHGASACSPTTGFTFPLASDKVNTIMPATHDKYVSGVDSPQFDVKVPNYVQSYNNSHFLGTVDDRMSSSTASSTLSDNAIDQWPVPPCEAQPVVISASQSMSSLLQQIDQPHVKQESIDQPLSPFTEKATGFEGSMMSNEYEQKPNNMLLINKLWNPGVINANDPLLNHHKHHIYESITAANLSQNLRQAAGMTAASVCNLQTMNNMQDFAGVHLAGHAYSVHQPSDQQLEQKPLPFHDVVIGNGETSLAAPDKSHEKERPTKRMARKVEGGINVYDMDIKQSMHPQSMVETTPCSSLMLHQSTRKQEQLLGAEYSLKRSRVEQSMPPSSTSTSSTTNNSCAFKSQPVRKEKLGERITTLQQLISPFGKTDTASVLMEAIGYIKFLQEQVQALSSPYFKDPTSQNGEKRKAGDETKRDLRSRGLCLVPLACTMHVANDNGADYWYGTSFR